MWTQELNTSEETIWTPCSWRACRQVSTLPKTKPVNRTKAQGWLLLNRWSLWMRWTFLEQWNHWSCLHSSHTPNQQQNRVSAPKWKENACMDCMWVVQVKLKAWWNVAKDQRIRPSFQLVVNIHPQRSQMLHYPKWKNHVELCYQLEHLISWRGDSELLMEMNSRLENTLINAIFGF